MVGGEPGVGEGVTNPDNPASEGVAALVGEFGVKTVEQALEAEKDRLRAELKETQIYQKMARLFPDAFISQDGSRLIVSEERTFIPEVHRARHEVKAKLAGDGTFSNVVHEANGEITADLVEPEGGITSVLVYVGKAQA